MTTNEALAEILDETIAALSDLDLGALDALEQRIIALAKSEEKFEGDGIGQVLRRKKLLEIVLQNYQVNLDVLTRLHTRNTRSQWAQ